MKITTLRLRNFQSFGPESVDIPLTEVNYILGPNGAGKTVVLEALSRLFSPIPAQRAIRLSDFHVPVALDSPTLDLAGAELWLEVDVEFPEASADGQHASIPPYFSHMLIIDEEDVPRVRIRLTAELAQDGVVDERIEYVILADEHGNPLKTEAMGRHDRGHIEVHYLPARRDPRDHISYATTSLLGRTLRAADWTQERETLTRLGAEITDALGANPAVATLSDQAAQEWRRVHAGAFFTEPTVAFGHSEIESILRQLTINFSPSHSGESVSYDRLSDGQKSLLYISLVLSWQALSRRVLAGDDVGLDPDKLRPPVHTIIALEEPENSLAPHYLGRIIRQLRESSAAGDIQAILATHAPALLRRVDPEQIRFLRLNERRETTVHRIILPSDTTEAAKYVQEAVRAYPELYFSRLVVLGEGASEQVVLPRVLAAAGIAEDDASVSVVPLGGRHVNHFWRLLDELRISHITLLDLDSARYQGGWGRVRNALKQLDELTPSSPKFGQQKIDALPKWDDDVDFPTFGQTPKAIDVLERHGVFFSHQLDLDLMMLEAYPSAYQANPRTPSPMTIAATLGKNRQNEHRLDSSAVELLEDYRKKFQMLSKPASHLDALSELDDDALIAGLPAMFQRMLQQIRDRLSGIPE